MKKFQGTGVAVITPFDESDNLDLSSLSNIIDFHIKEKVEYLVILGTTGESVTLTDDEQSKVIDTFIEVNKGRVPLVLGVGGNNTRKVSKRVEEVSKKYNLDGILSVSPYYNKPSQAGIYAHYAEIAKNTDLPIILYNVPGRTSSNISSSITLKLAHEFQHIVAVKEASGNFEQCMEIIRERPEGFLVLSGDDVFSLPIISLGGNGAISVIANAFPRKFGNLVRYALSGNYQAAQNLQYDLLSLMDLAFREGNPVGVKAMMHIKGLCIPSVRLPLVNASSELTALIQKELA